VVRFKWWQFAIVAAVSVGFVVALFTIAELGRARLGRAAVDVRRAQQQWMRVVDVQQIVLNAESAHRGFLLTGDSRYLEPLLHAGERIDALTGQLVRTYQGRDEGVRSAMQQLRSVADARMVQMRESVAIYRQQGPAAGLALANSASRHETMARFRELAAIIQDYEQSLLELSLANWDRELAVAYRLNVATLLVGLLLTVLALSAMSRSIRHRLDAAAELARQHDQLKAQADAQAAELIELYRHLQHVQEEERARLSRGLHDELGGVLLAARMDVTWMQHNSPHDPKEFQERLERVRRVLDQGIDLKRRVVEELRPTLLDTMGLVAALRWQIEESCKRAGLRCIENFPEIEPQFNRAGAITLFRVVQEALANVLKHAGAKEVRVAMEMTEEHVVLTISDDGVGSTTEALNKPRSHGIAGMRHRVHVLGGRLDIATSPGRGVHVRVEVPLASVMQPTGVDAGTSGVFAAIPWAERSDSPAAAS
jgi:signal transduction histidine kinase